jgi:diguanylate cyclase (GGDEF)-like protein
MQAGSLMLEIQTTLKNLERRDWWLWWGAVVVMLLLTLAVVALAVPTLFRDQDSFFQFNMNQAVRGLVALVLLFNVYTIYQQILIKRLRRQIAMQMDTMIALNTRAEEFHKLSVMDPLTGLYNRRFADQRLAEEVARSQRHGHPLSVMVIDLNRFKQINDQFGHIAGDTVLKSFADRLRKAVRYSDLPVRSGGDEFMVSLTDCRVEQAQVLLSRLQGIQVDLKDRKIPVTFSAGWTGYQEGDSVEEMVHRADLALYEQKRAGRRAEAPVPVTT